jgi:UDP-N-acetylmuramate-alanine ligase
VDSLPGGRELAGEIALRGGRGSFIGDLEEAVDVICETVCDNDVVILMGAGDIDEIAGPLAEKLRQA